MNSHWCMVSIVWSNKPILRLTFEAKALLVSWALISGMLVQGTYQLTPSTAVRYWHCNIIWHADNISLEQDTDAIINAEPILLSTMKASPTHKHLHVSKYNPALGRQDDVRPPRPEHQTLVSLSFLSHQ